MGRDQEHDKHGRQNTAIKLSQLGSTACAIHADTDVPHEEPDRHCSVAYSTSGSPGITREEDTLRLLREEAEFHSTDGFLPLQPCLRRVADSRHASAQ